ncbi:MAG: HD domain-containing protein [candidate division WOR-3 bacterium]
MNYGRNRKLVLRDPLYGLIEYSEKEKELMNTWALQRLRRIHQLAMAYLVYPSAHHNRFEHSIGVMHLAGEVARRVGCSDEEIKLIRLAGLLHDVGHGPFSHVSEAVLEKYSCLDGDVESLHEGITCDIILNWPEFEPILSEEERKEIADIISKERYDYLGKIISGPIDVDKLDYLLRDSYFAGVKYGTFDLPKVVESIVGVDDGLCIKEEGVFAVEQLLLASYHMREQVYRHRVRRITDAMLVEGLSRAVESKRLMEEANNNPDFNIARIYRYEKNSRKYLEHYMGFYDEKVLSILSNKNWEGEPFYPLCKRLKERCLLKEVLNESLTEFEPDSVNRGKLKKKLKEPGIKSLIAQKIYEKLSNQPEFSKGLGLTQDLIITDWESIKSPAYDLWGHYLSGDGETITVLLKRSGARESFLKKSKVFAPPPPEDERIRLNVYLPQDNTTSDQREQIRGDWRELIKQAMKEVLYNE